MKLVVIVLCYNDFENARKYLSIIKNYKSIDKIIVVDNNSKKEIFDKLSSFVKYDTNDDKIELIRTNDNLGYARGNNYGIRYAIEKYNPQIICISNTDVEYEENVVTRVISFIERQNNVGIVAPVMLDVNGNESLSAWKLPNYFEILWNASFIRQKFFDPQRYKSFSRQVENVDALPGSLFYCKSSVLLKIGLFDENTFLYGEESLLAFKTKKYGFKNYLLRDISFIHQHSKTIDKNIKSVKMKRKYLLDANCVYLSHCLKVGKFKTIIYRLVFNVATFKYSIYCKLKNHIL